MTNFTSSSALALIVTYVKTGIINDIWGLMTAIQNVITPDCPIVRGGIFVAHIT